MNFSTKSDRITVSGLLVTVFVLFCDQAWCGDIYVISNTALTISADDIKDIYTGEKLVEGGVKLIPIDNNSVKVDFLEKVVHVSAAKYSAMWAKKVFQDGLAVPLLKASDADVIAMVKAKPGNIGYVSSPTPDVLVIKKF